MLLGLEKLVNLASYGYYGGGEFQKVLDVWAEYGFFSHILPFLLIFSFVFIILRRIDAFKDNKSISAIISVVVGLMALQFDFVPVFFSEIFPRVGVGLAIILLLIIFLGLFIDKNQKGLMYTLMGVGAVVFIIILIQSAGAIGWQSAHWWYDNWEVVAGAVFILALIAIIVGAGSDKESKPSHFLMFNNDK